MSDLGLLSYRYYWRTSIVKAILDLQFKHVSVYELCQKTRMTPDDVIHTLFLMDMVGKTEQGDYIIRCNKKELVAYHKKIQAKGYLTLAPENLKWDPVLYHRILHIEPQDSGAPESSQVSIQTAHSD